MKNRSKQIILLSIFTIVSVTIFTYIFINTYKTEKILNNVKTQKEVLGTEDSLVVSAVLPYYISVKIKPEERIPSINNDKLEINIKINIAGSPNSTIDETLTTDSSGFTDLTAVDPSTFTAGNYDIYIKGSSHLTTKFPNEPIGPVAISDHDLTFNVLRAGDSHPVADDYINSLDISYIINQFGTNNLQADLNRDGIVNETDLNILLKNLYKTGDL